MKATLAKSIGVRVFLLSPWQSIAKDYESLNFSGIRFSYFHLVLVHIFTDYHLQRLAKRGNETLVVLKAYNIGSNLQVHLLFGERKYIDWRCVVIVNFLLFCPVG